MQHLASCRLATTHTATSRAKFEFSPPQSPRFQQVPARSYYSGRPAEKFHRDVGFGVSDSSIRELCAKKKLAADYKIYPYLTKPQRSAYRKAAGNGPGQRALGFDTALEDLGRLGGKRRGDLVRRDAKYSPFLDTITEDVEANDGKVVFLLEKLDLVQHLCNCVAIECENDRPFEHFVDQATLAEIHQNTSVTNVELGYYLEARNTDVPLHVYVRKPDQASPRKISTEKFRRLYLAAADATRSPENIEHLRKHGRFNDQAIAAVGRLQQYVHGTTDTLGHLWKGHSELVRAREWMGLPRLPVPNT